MLSSILVHHQPLKPSTVLAPSARRERTRRITLALVHTARPARDVPAPAALAVMRVLDASPGQAGVLAVPDALRDEVEVGGEDVVRGA